MFDVECSMFVFSSEPNIQYEGRMTTHELISITCVYLVGLVAIAYFTRATARRVAGALAGGAAAGWLGLGAIALGEALAWWRVPTTRTPYFLPLAYLGFAVSLAPIYLVTWRVARRFGRRGLAVCLGAVAVVGPPRDYLFAAAFPEWIVFAGGVAPVLAVAATYVGWVGLGHAVMHLIAGPARGDRLRGLGDE
jgi:hypothetical protein